MKFFASIFLLFISHNVIAQSKANYGYTNAVLHLKKGDSLICLVEKQVAYDQTLLYKLSDYGAVEEIPIAEINYFKTNDKSFYSLPLYNSYTLMELVDSGKMTLYFFNEIKYGERKFDPKTGYRIKKGDIIIHYVVSKAGAVQEIIDSTFKTILKQLFSDCERMAGKVTRGDYLFEDMPQIIKDYNVCKNQYCSHSSTSEKTD